MNAVFSASQAQICQIAAGRLVLSRGKPEDVARWLGCSIDTVERMRASDDPGRWTMARINDLIAYERQTFGSNHLAQAMADSLAGAVNLVCSKAFRIESEIATGLTAVLGFGALEAASIADGRVDDDECRRLLDAGPAAQEHLRKVLEAAADRLQRRTP